MRVLRPALWVVLSVFSLCAAENNPAEPDGALLAQIRTNFLALKRPLSFACKSVEWKEKTDMMFPERVVVTLNGDTKKFAEAYESNELVYALWQYLDDETEFHDAEAFMILSGALCLNYLPYESNPDFVSARHPGAWRRNAEEYIEDVKRKAANKIGKPSGWHGPGPRSMFPEEIIKDKAGRDANIRKMMACLSDQRLRKKDPGQVDEIMGLLAALQVTDAIPLMAEMLLFDWRTGDDIDKAEESNLEIDIDRCSGATMLAYFGEMSWPYVWKKLADTARSHGAHAPKTGCVVKACILMLDLSGDKNAKPLKSLEFYHTSTHETNTTVLAAFDLMAQTLRQRDDTNVTRAAFTTWRQK